MNEGHLLSPLLAPRSIAIIGASVRPETTSNITLAELVGRGFTGDVYPVNPRYETVQGLPCFSSVHQIPEVPDLAILAVSNERLESQMEMIAECGIPSVAIFASGHLEDDNPSSPLSARLQSIARQADIKVCGGNCMGFRNLSSNVHVATMREPGLVSGPVAFISQSGTAYGQMLAVDGRAGYQLAASAGQEFTVTVADYIDYALDNPDVRCVALFLEAIRDPDRFVAAIERANRQNIPVVALKVGRSEAAAKFAVTHTGALVGNDLAYQAFFDRHGVIRVEDLGDMLNVIQLLCYGRPFAPGGLAALMDSGGKRELMMDHLDRIGLPVAEISEKTRATLAENIDPGLDPVNPLDFWDTGFDWKNRVTDCTYALAEDPATAVCALSGIVNWGGSTAFVDVLTNTAAKTEKPLAMLTEFLRADDVASISILNDAGVPLLIGEQSGLQAIEQVRQYHRFLNREPEPVATCIDAAWVQEWRPRIASTDSLDEANSLALLGLAGIRCADNVVVETEADLLAAGERLGYPVVLKTASPRIHHKSDVGGVKLNLCGPEALAVAYRDMKQRLGPRVLISSQVTEPGVEISLGLVVDPVAGPLVMLSAGGTLIEVLDDKVCALAPVSVAQASEMIDQLAIAPLLAGTRGQTPLDVDDLAATFARFSVLCVSFQDVISEMDVNPLLVTAEGCIALDALVVPRVQS